MKTTVTQSRRNFLNTLTASAALAGISLIPQPLQAGMKYEKFDFNLDNLPKGEELDKELKALGQKAHPVAYDISQANPWGLIWSNVYYLTNGETGTTADKLGILNVFRHHGMVYGLNDETIKKYKLGEFFHLIDPITNAPAIRNPYYDPEDGVFPLPGLAGIKGLHANGTMFCICDMARKVYAQFVGQKEGIPAETVYNDFVAGTFPEVQPAPSGVWVLGRLAENKIAYIDASVG